MAELISNQLLQLGGIPDEKASDEQLRAFALAFDGHKEFDLRHDRPNCEQLASKRDSSSLSRTRACLFHLASTCDQSKVPWDRSQALELIALIRRQVHTDRYRIPGVKGKEGATTADLVKENNALCQANIETIERVCRFNGPREVRDEINRRLRAAHNLLGMAAGQRRYGCLYYEENIDTKSPMVVEHAVPVTGLVNLFQQGRSFLELVFLPVALISRSADQRLSESNRTKSGHDETLELVLRRYAGLGISLVTYDGVSVDPETWTMRDHMELIYRTRELSEIYHSIKQDAALVGDFSRSEEDSAWLNDKPMGREEI